MSRTGLWSGAAILYAVMALLFFALAGAVTLSLGLLAGALFVSYTVTRIMKGAMARFRTYTAE